MLLLICGQLISFLIACGGAAQASLYIDCHLSVPTFSMALVYFCLSFCLLSLYCKETTATTATTIKSIDIKNKKRSKLSISIVETEIQQQSTTVMDSSKQTGECNNIAIVDNDIINNSNGTAITIPHNDPVPESSLFLTRQQQTYLQQRQQGEDEELTTRVILDNNYHYSFLCGHVVLTAPAYRYLLLAIIDVYANYFTVLAFKYTTITSATLLDVLSIPTSMILSKLFLQRKYTIIHLIGVTLCIIGVLLNVLRDYEDDHNQQKQSNSNNNNGDDTNTEFPYKVRGDIYAIIGGILFGTGNVLAEVCVKYYGGPNEYLGMIGFFGLIICTIQAFIFEREVVSQLLFGWDDHNNDNDQDDNHPKCSPVKARFILSSFVLVCMISYMSAARFLQYSEAAFFNLSLLTGDLWSVLFSVVSFKILPKPLFYVALVVTVAGVVIYESSPSSVQEDDYGNSSSYYQHVHNQHQLNDSNGASNISLSTNDETLSDNQHFEASEGDNDLI